MTLKKKIFIGILSLIIIGVVAVSLQKPSLDRDWAVDQAVLSEISFEGETVEVKNIRDFLYTTATEYEIGYYDETFDLDSIESVYYIIEPFSSIDGPAHTMLSFGFENGRYVAVSSEIRKEKGESFSPWWGLVNKYEMVYVVGSERDLIKLRANYRKNDVFMYPIKTSKQNMRELFVGVMQRASSLSKNPEFYNTLTNTCTTSILDHINTLREENGKTDIAWSTQIFLPSDSDEIAYDAGLIDTQLTLEEAREYYRMNELSTEFGENEDYSKLIRKPRK